LRFIDFCKSVTNVDDNGVKNDTNVTLPDKYVKAINVLTKQFKPKSHIIQGMSVPYIESAFKLKNTSLSDEMVRICEKEFHTREIPDKILLDLSNGIFGYHYNNLSTNFKIIIKTMAMYILLSNK
jgi:hypothetical protein